MKTIRLSEQSLSELLLLLDKRSPAAYGKYEEIVQGITRRVRDEGDGALFALTKEFDGFDLSADTLSVTKEEIDAAYRAVDETLLSVIRKSAGRIRAFHEKQKTKSWFDTEDGILLGQKVTPLERVGVYVPGGKAAYPSSVLMNIIPAKVAGVPNIIMVTPPQKTGRISPVTLVAASEAGADRILRIGGAQAVAALAYGTASVPKVDKITGPGNIFVALAKRAVYGHVAIDSIAGPSEILVLADGTANPRYVAADLLSQAEHDELASAILITTDERLARETACCIEQMTKELPRRQIIEKALKNYGHILVADTMEEAIRAANMIASEHLEILTEHPFDVMMQIRHAGAIFMGAYATEPLGDYYAGPNHVLPTNRTARFFSPLSVDDFVKKSSLIYYTKEAFLAAADDVSAFAEAEGLSAHAASVYVRKEGK